MMTEGQQQQERYECYGCAGDKLADGFVSFENGMRIYLCHDCHKQLKVFMSMELVLQPYME